MHILHTGECVLRNLDDRQKNQTLTVNRSKLPKLCKKPNHQAFIHLASKRVYIFSKKFRTRSRINLIKKKRSVTSDRNAVTSFGQYFNQTHLLIDYGPTSHNFFSKKNHTIFSLIAFTFTFFLRFSSSDSLFYFFLFDFVGYFVIFYTRNVRDVKWNRSRASREYTLSIACTFFYVDTSGDTRAYIEKPEYNF